MRRAAGHFWWHRHSCLCSPEGAEEGDMGREVRIKRRNLPHWRMAGATYFITFRVAEGELTPAERQLIFDHLLAGNGRFYDLAGFVIMPDHVHGVLAPRQGYELDRITKGVKGVTARLVNEVRGRRGSLWQDESWDRIVRDQKELDEKLEYMRDNPAKRELVADPWDYPWLWFDYTVG